MSFTASPEAQSGVVQAPTTASAGRTPAPPQEKKLNVNAKSFTPIANVPMKSPPAGNVASGPKVGAATSNNKSQRAAATSTGSKPSAARSVGKGNQNAKKKSAQPQPQPPHPTPPMMQGMMPPMGFKGSTFTGMPPQQQLGKPFAPQLPPPLLHQMPPGMFPGMPPGMPLMTPPPPMAMQHHFHHAQHHSHNHDHNHHHPSMMVPPMIPGMMQAPPPPPPPGFGMPMPPAAMMAGPGGAPMIMPPLPAQMMAPLGQVPIPGIMPFSMPTPHGAQATGPAMPLFTGAQMPLPPPPQQQQQQQQRGNIIAAHRSPSQPALMLSGQFGSGSMSSITPMLASPGSTSLEPGAPPGQKSGGPVRVSVGNASLAALYSKEPPKFSCVLLSGIPAVGKTTMGRQLVDSLQTDKMGWAFFSGGDFLAEAPTKRTVWDTTKEVFDALDHRLNELMERQREKRNIKGLVIDKNCKGIEDIYYLNALLKAKNIPFVGIIGMETNDDDVLIKRMGGGEELREKLKYHRVIHARITSLAKAAGMYRSVDAAKSPSEVTEALRTMVLGCCAQPPARGIRTHQYDSSRANTMVDTYGEYFNVLTHLFNCVTTRSTQFPGSTDFVPFSTREMTEKGRISAFKSRYGIRRRVDGNRYLLLYFNNRLFLIPSHMRAVLQMPQRSWLGEKLEGIGSFVLEGDLVRLTRDRQKEMFLVFDAHFWSEATNPAQNILIRMNWTERQACLKAHLCAEESAFFPAESECVIVHHATQKFDKCTELLDSEEYPSDGLVFQPINQLQRSDNVFVWRQPSGITVDFRVGVLKGITDATVDEGDDGAEGISVTVNRRGSIDPFHSLPVRTYALEVYDKVEKKYVKYGDAVVELRHPDVVEGCIVTCSLRDDAPRGWLFNRVRYDILRPAFRHEVDELLAWCIIPRAKLVSWFIAEHFVTVELPKAPNPPEEATPPPSYGAATGSLAALSGQMLPHSTAPDARINIGALFPTASALVGSRRQDPHKSPSQQYMQPPPPPQAAAAALSAGDTAAAAQSQLQLLASIVPSMQVVRSPAAGSRGEVAKQQPSAPAASAAGATVSSTAPVGSEARTQKEPENSRQTCAQCHRRKPAEEMRVDKRDRRNYCYQCWAQTGWAFCAECEQFKEGPRNPQQRGRGKGTFLCYGCAKTSQKSADGATAAADTTPAEKDQKQKEPRPAHGGGGRAKRNSADCKASTTEAAGAKEVKGAKAQRARGKKSVSPVADPSPASAASPATVPATEAVAVAATLIVAAATQQSQAPLQADAENPRVAPPSPVKAKSVTPSAEKPAEKKGGMCAQQ